MVLITIVKKRAVANYESKASTKETSARPRQLKLLLAACSATEERLRYGNCAFVIYFPRYL